MKLLDLIEKLQKLHDRANAHQYDSNRDIDIQFIIKDNFGHYAIGEWNNRCDDRFHEGTSTNDNNIVFTMYLKDRKAFPGEETDKEALISYRKIR